jgi:quinol monooxygenase YgiN
MSSKLAPLLTGALVGGVFVLAAAHVPWLIPSWCRTERKCVYVLLVRLKLNPAMGGLKAFTEAWAPLAKDVLAKEPGCLSYELCSGESDENEIIIYERYASKSDLTETHNSGAAFKAFGKLLGEGGLKGLVLEKEKATYWETNVGFMER